MSSRIDPAILQLALKQIPPLPIRRMGKLGLIIVLAVSGRLEKSSALIFLSYIFLFWFCRQENVGEENADLRISQIVHYGRDVNGKLSELICGEASETRG
jgi:hypothetical protein